MPSWVAKIAVNARAVNLTRARRSFVGRESIQPAVFASANGARRIQNAVIAGPDVSPPQ